MRTRSRCSGLLALIGLVALGGVAAAAPSSVAVEAIFRSLDCSPTCDPEDGGLKQDARVEGSIEIHVSASSEVVGLNFVRLEAQTGQDPFYYCLQQWEAEGARDFAAHFDWDTRNWPGRTTEGWGCRETSPHKHGVPTVDGLYRLRVVATESVNNEQATSSDFRIRIDNDDESASPSPTPTATGSRQIPPPSSRPRVKPSDRTPTPTPSGEQTVVAPVPSVVAGAPTAARLPRRPQPDRARPYLLFVATALLGATVSSLVGQVRARRASP